MNAGLNARRKADREQIAAGFVAVAEKMGATIERRDEPAFRGWHGAEIRLGFTLNGVGASVCISDLHGGEDGLISWFNDYSCQPRPANGDYMALKTYRFERSFETAVGSQGSARPHHKATSGGTWDLLAARLQAGLRKARDGLAFIAEMESVS